MPDGDDPVAVMLARDTASAALGIEHVGPGTVRMTVGAAMVNGLEVCHGGLLFTLADTAMAVASNAGEHRAFAAAAAIDFLRPAARGAVLEARAVERHRAGRSALWDVDVTDTVTGDVVATFRGRTVAVTPPA